MTGPMVILDADGVFLDERPYWDAALRAALTFHNASVPQGAEWHVFSRIAFEELGLQRITKQRGCNSNFDLSAVLGLTLSDPAARKALDGYITARDWRSVVHAFIDHATKTWERTARATSDSTRATSDSNVEPLSGFGIDRYGSYFMQIQLAFQDALQSVQTSTGVAAQSVLRGKSDEIKQALGQLKAWGVQLAVCTGRVADELLPAMTKYGLETYFKKARLMTADQVTQAENALNIRPLGKPHWFPLLCAAFGQQIAQETLSTGVVKLDASMPIAYVGDGLADFQAATGTQQLGVPLTYVHMRSGVTTPIEESRISNSPVTLGIIDQLAELPKLLQPWIKGIGA